MSRAADKQARTEAILGELAELGLALARDLAAQARACEDPDQQVALVEAFHQTSRTVRLTLALNAKLDRDAAREAREAARDAAADEEARTRAERLAAVSPVPPALRSATEVRKDRVRNLLNRLIWNEAEGDAEEYEVLFDDLAARLDEAALAPGFEDIPVETLARRVAADMGLSGKLIFTASEAPAEAAVHATPPRTPALADSG